MGRALVRGGRPTRPTRRIAFAIRGRLRYSRDGSPAAQARTPVPAELDPRQLALAETRKRYLAAHGVGREASDDPDAPRSAQAAAARLRRRAARRPGVPSRRPRRVPLHLPPASAYGIMQALRQTLEAAVAWGLMTRTPRSAPGRTRSRSGRVPPVHAGRDRRARRRDRNVGLARRFAARPACALRSGALWSGATSTATPASSPSSGPTHAACSSRTERPLRVAPPRAALVARPRRPRAGAARIGSAPLLFAGAEAATSTCTTGARASGCRRSTPPACRGGGSTTSGTPRDVGARCGVTLFELSRFMGTSIRMIDATYGHLAHGSERPSARSSTPTRRADVVVTA